MVVKQPSYRRLACDGVLGLEWVWQECGKCPSLEASELGCPNQESSHLILLSFGTVGVYASGILLMKLRMVVVWPDHRTLACDGVLCLGWVGRWEKSVLDLSPRNLGSPNQPGEWPLWMGVCVCVVIFHKWNYLELWK